MANRVSAGCQRKYTCEALYTLYGKFKEQILVLEYFALLLEIRNINIDANYKEYSVLFRVRAHTNRIWDGLVWGSVMGLTSVMLLYKKTIIRFFSRWAFD